MKVALQRWTLDKKSWIFYFDEHYFPVLEIEGKIYKQDNLAQLFADYPLLTRVNYVMKASQLVNYLLQGLNYTVIENVEEFKQEYLDRLQSENKLIQLRNYSAFDVNVLHAPKKVNEKLIFYVKQEATQLPYRVTVDLPVGKFSPIASYELLPFV